MIVTLKFIGKTPDDRRYFIRAGGLHAGGITLHDVSAPSFSYGIAVKPIMRRQHVATAALTILFEKMRKEGFTDVRVQIEPNNEASLALHRRLGFAVIDRSEQAVTMTRTL